MGDRSKSCSFVILCVLAVGCPSILCADSPEQVSVAVGEEFTVKLASNPTTGYSWTLADALPSWLVQVNQAYIADTSGLAGAGGTEHWTFRATAAGSATLTFQYERPWEGMPADTHVCQVTARLPTDTEYIFVATGQDFTLALASNPSTGYSWALAGSLPSWLQKKGDPNYVPADPALLGGGGTEYWTFHATATGSVTLTFQYERPSDSTPGKVRVCQVTAAAPADRENIFVVAGESFTLALASNPTTGYSWTPAVSLPGWLQQVSQTYVATNPGTIGGGGTEYWTFQATAAGSANLVFQYERPWEGTPAQTHVSQVTATAPTDKDSIFVATGENFMVALASNPSTGYSWALAGSLPSWLKQVSKTYVAANPGLLGGGGTDYWTFQAAATGSATLTFQYARPSDSTPSKVRVCQVTAAAPADTEDIFVATGENFTVALASNPTTGYSWALAASLPSWLQQVSKTYVATNPGTIGGGGTEYWTFQATAAGSVTLVFQYERPWEGTPIKTHVCKVATAMQEPNLDGFETGSFSILAWRQQNTPWQITPDRPFSGKYSAKSGTIGDNGMSTLTYTRDCQAGKIGFAVRISSQPQQDCLFFRIDGQQIAVWSGAQAWTQVSYPVAAGTHTFTWSYEKDRTTFAGEDAAWIDEVSFPAPDSP